MFPTKPLVLVVCLVFLMAGVHRCSAARRLSEPPVSTFNSTAFMNDLQSGLPNIPDMPDISLPPIPSPEIPPDFVLFGLHIPISKFFNYLFGGKS